MFFSFRTFFSSPDSYISFTISPNLTIAFPIFGFVLTKSFTSGPNGAGKTTLISIICGIVKPSIGKVTVDGYDIINDYRETRSRIGLVPQELTLESFETVFNF